MESKPNRPLFDAPKSAGPKPATDSRKKPTLASLSARIDDIEASGSAPTKQDTRISDDLRAAKERLNSHSILLKDNIQVAEQAKVNADNAQITANSALQFADEAKRKGDILANAIAGNQEDMEKLADTISQINESLHGMVKMHATHNEAFDLVNRRIDVCANANSRHESAIAKCMRGVRNIALADVVLGLMIVADAAVHLAIYYGLF